jgi:protease II
MLYIHSGSAVTSETLFMPADTPEGTFKVILPRTQDVEYRWAHWGAVVSHISLSADTPEGTIKVVLLIV